MKDFLALLFSLVALSATATSLQLVSQTAGAFVPSDSAGGDSTLPLVSPDGRYVLFASSANNLALTTNNTPYRAPQFTCLNTYLRDRSSNNTVLVSVNVDGIGGADRDAMPIAISTNGQFVLFESAADNLVPGDTNSASDVFVRDLVNGITIPVSVNTNGVCSSGASDSSAMTPDGRYVAFSSTAPDLAPGVTNKIANVYVRDLQGQTTVLVSVGAITTGTSPLSLSDAAEITPDGRYVAFYSTATNLVSGFQTSADVYVRDLAGGTTLSASSAARSSLQWPYLRTNSIAFNFRISDDGNYVAFQTASNQTGVSAIFRYNVGSGFTDLICSNAYLPSTALESFQDLDMSPDGRFVGYVADLNDTSGTNTAIYLWDAQTGTNILISANTNGVLPAPTFCDAPLVSSNGQYVAFLSGAAELATHAFGNGPFLYLRNLTAGTTSLVNTDTNGESLGDPSILGFSMSPDAQFIAFESALASLIPNDANRDFDAFLNNTVTGANELVSVRQPTLPSRTANGPSTISFHPLSQDGHYLAFASDAEDLAAGDTNQSRDVFVRDLFAGTNFLVSIGFDGSIGSASSSEPAISGNGRYVAFTSAATNLVAGDTNNSTDVFVRDLQAQTTSLVSVDAAGTGEGNTNSYTPTISSDGRFVLFLSKAKNLTAGTFSGTDNLFLRDTHAGTNYALTTAGEICYAMTPDGHVVVFTGTSGKYYLWDSQLAQLVATNTTSGSVTAFSISPDGNRIAYAIGSGSAVQAWDRAANQVYSVGTGYFASHIALRFSADGRFLANVLANNTSVSQVHLYDFQGATNILVSHDASSATVGNASSDSPDISADGHYVVYRSAATNLVAGDTNNATDIILFDVAAGTNSIVSAGVYGNVAADNGSFTPLFSGDGHTLVFASFATDLVTGDFNQYDDLFSLTLQYLAAITSGAGNPTISWPASTNQTYSVQYKDDLTDPTWSTVSGTVTINGNRAYLTDTTMTSSHRFYRIVTN